MLIHKANSSLMVRSLKTSSQGWVPKPGHAHQWDLNQEASDYEYNMLFHSVTLPTLWDPIFLQTSSEI